MNKILIGSLFFIYGIFFGSFFNVVADRWLIDKSIKGRSQCDNCGYTLKVKNLIPIISFVTQKGKCSECGIKLSFAYPIAEIMTGISFLMVYLAFGLSVNTIIGTLFISILIVSTLTDYKEGYVLDRVVMIPSMIIFILSAIYTQNFLFFHLFPTIVFGIIFFIAVKMEKLGEGDLILILDTFIVFGMLLGSIAMLISSLIAVIIMLFNKKRMLPFIPFWFVGNLSIYVMISFNLAIW